MKALKVVALLMFVSFGEAWALSPTIQCSSLSKDSPIKLVVPNCTIVGSYQHKDYPSWGLRTHVGVDIFAALGTPMHAMAYGSVVDVVQQGDRNFNSLGNAVIIKHPALGRNGSTLYSLYLHMQNAPSVSVNSTVQQGDPIGLIGATGSANGINHTHFELRYFQNRFPVKWGNIYCTGDCTQHSYIDANWENPMTFTLITAKAVGDLNSGTLKITGYRFSNNMSVHIGGLASAFSIDSNSNLLLNISSALDNSTPISIKDAGGQVIWNSYYPFSDVKPNEWYTEYLIPLWKKRVIKGHSDGTFKPSQPVSKAEFVKMAVVASKVCSDLNNCGTSGANPPYSDVNIHWAYPYIKEASTRGWLPNTSTFSPDQNISRSDVAAIISNAKGLSLPWVPGTFSDVFPSRDSASHIMGVSQNGIMTGYKNGNFGPTDPLTRAQAAKVIHVAFFNNNIQ